jgi:hypothetical protein
LLPRHDREPQHIGKPSRSQTRAEPASNRHEQARLRPWRHKSNPPQLLIVAASGLMSTSSRVKMPNDAELRGLPARTIRHDQTMGDLADRTQITRSCALGSGIGGIGPAASQ